MPARSARLLAGLLATAGATHLLYPKPYDAIVPSQLPGSARAWTQGSAAAELALAAAVALPATRKAGALLTAGFFVAVFPANVKMAYDWRHRREPYRSAAIARLPVQAPLVLWALKVSRNAAR
ncbi:DoxX family protein [Streptomyces sp. CA-111067]|uniref:DoxX family protein n=1 Tax=Streptomyces sp. CA-111067 TaxID=3240046 RepID=UPI003D98FE6D